MSCPPELRKAYREDRVLPFIGAGASMSVVWEKNGEEVKGPSWSELVDQATKLLGFSDSNLARVRGKDLQILEYFKRKNAGQTAKLTNWLGKLMDPPDAALQMSQIHKELASLDRCKLFYTTNFDDFIERAFELHGRTPHIVAVESQMGGVRQDCEIVKFHGGLDHPDQIVLTELEYEQRLSLSTSMDYRLRADLLGRVVLFVGYSFRDPNVSYLFRLFTDEFWQKPGARPGNRAFIFVADPSDFEFELFDARHIQVIPVRGVKMSEDIAKVLREMRG